MKKIFLKYHTDDRGISIIGTIFTLIILGVLGTALVSMVAVDQKSRTTSIHREYAFYAVQAGFEYVLREINEGGYPIVTNKILDNATFTNTLNCSSKIITSVGSSYESSKSYSITAPLISSDCLTINTAGAAVGGASNNEIQGIVLTKTCLNAVTVDSMTLTWDPNSGQTVDVINIDGVDVYDDPGVAALDDEIDITDTKIVASADIDYIRFSSSVSGMTGTITLTMTDSCSVQEAFALP